MHAFEKEVNMHVHFSFNSCLYEKTDVIDVQLYGGGCAISLAFHLSFFHTFFYLCHLYFMLKFMENWKYFYP